MRKMCGTTWAANERILRSVYQKGILQHTEKKKSTVWCEGSCQQTIKHLNLRHGAQTGNETYHRNNEVQSKCRTGNYGITVIL